MNNNFFAAAIAVGLMTGCSPASDPISVTPPPEVVPPEVVPPTYYNFFLLSGGVAIEGAECDGIKSGSGGKLELTYTSADIPNTITCSTHGSESRKLASFSINNTARSADYKDYKLDISDSDLINTDTTFTLANVQVLLLAIDSDGLENNGIQLNSKSNIHYANNIADAASKSKADFLTDNISPVKDDKPSGIEPGHGSDVVPEISAGSGDLTGDSGVISSNAEQQYSYKPVKAVPEFSHLIFNNDGVAGIDYYGPSFRGQTDSDGKFEYNWGDTVTFGVQALTLGEIAAKGLDVELGQLAADPSKASNVENFVRQFDIEQAAPWLIDKLVHDRLALESNNIVELINMGMANGEQPEDPNFSGGVFPSLENEFLAQFNTSGSASDIIADLKFSPLTAVNYSYSPYVSVSRSTSSESAADALKFMMGQGDSNLNNDVHYFHVFGNQNDGYRLPSPHAATFINIDNNAAPVVMPRSDLNAYIPFGQLAVTDKFSRPFFDLTHDVKTTPTYIDVKNKTHWNLQGQLVADDSLESSYKMNKETATFELPFVVSGKIGAGKVLVLGNSLYNSILVCPENYSYNSSIKDGVCANGSGTTDSLDMFNFFANALTWLDTKNRGIKIATNRVDGYFAQINGYNSYSFALSPKFTNLNMTMETGVFPQNVDVNTHPIYILQAYPVRDSHPDRPDYDSPLIDENDVNALIYYVNKGGSVLIMESLYARNLPVLGRFLDTAGISSIGRYNMVKFAGKLPSNFIAEVDKARTSLRPVYTEEVYVLEGLNFEANSSGSSETPEKGYKYNKDTNTYYWGDKSVNNKAVLRALFRPQQVRDNQRHNVTQNCSIAADGNKLTAEEQTLCIDTKLSRLTQEGLDKWISDVQAIYNVPMCTNADYQYQLDCIERREGNGIPISKTTYPGANDMVQAYARLPMSKEVSDAMIAAANMGTNLTDLYQHELYYRTSGNDGVRLSGIDVDRIYNNLSAWLVNNEQYRYDPNAESDEFGHKTVVQFLNCYSDNRYAPDSETCPRELKQTLVAKGFLIADGEDLLLNPSYPLNYMEKPLTRLLMGRSYFDVDAKNASADDRGIKVDVRNYPGVATQKPSAQNMTVHKGSRQSTGVWVDARQYATISGLAENDTVMVAMADNLTGRINHEMALNRPPRVSMSFTGSEAAMGFKVPYGGMVYITLRSAESTEVSFRGAVSAAPLFEMTSATNGHWVTSPNESDAPLTEIVTNRFSYTTTTAGIKGHSDEAVLQMAMQWDLFTLGVNEFYGRDEVTGSHQMFTDSELPFVNMRMVDDIQISIGSAHSGYPVMNSRFPRSQTTSLINASNNWLVGHEIGHNQASNWLNVPGAGETANNVLALYSQERNTGEMARIKNSILNAPQWVNNDHPWANGTSGDRLNFFGQLKIWAEDNFDITKWETNDRLAEPRSIYNKDAKGDYDQGWNFIKLLHRKARGDDAGDASHNGTNYCAQQAGVSTEGMLMVCSSYLTGTDLESFFTNWNVGEIKMTLLNGDVYGGGVSEDNAAMSLMAEMRSNDIITTGNSSPAAINAIKSKPVLLPQTPYY